MKVKHWVIACAGLLLASCEKDVKVEVKDVLLIYYNIYYYVFGLN